MRQTRKRRARFVTLLLLVGVAAPSGTPQAAEQADVDRLVAAMLGDTPLLDDLRELTDEIGGRPSGTEANRKSVEWALERFRRADIDARKEAFTVPEGWLERSARAEVRGHSGFPVRVASMPYSAPTPDGGLHAPLLDGGPGGEENFERLGKSARGAFVLVETPPLLDLPGLFAEYMTASAVEDRAERAGVVGLVYVGSRPSAVLYRQIVARGPDNELPMLVVERDAGLRLLRLLRAGRSLSLLVDLDIETGGPFESHNVIAEIPGRELPDEIVVAGAHLDSWGLGQGALDNGSGVVLLIDIARQIRRLGIQPRRTIRFCLFNDEELGFFGSLGYTRTHLDEMDRHVVAQSYDTGSGRIKGFFTNGRPELKPALDRALEPVRGLGPFENPDLPIVGTDNFDFLLQGVANLVGDQESANYGPNYHASSDTFDKIDQRQLRLNAAIAAAVTWSFAEMEVDWKRQRRAEVQRIIDTTDLGKQMRAFHFMESWEKGERGLPK
jgi:hypothetical protein